jgi:hypothetical protein
MIQPILAVNQRADQRVGDAQRATRIGLSHANVEIRRPGPHDQPYKVRDG